MKNVRMQVISLHKMEVIAALTAIEVVLDRCGSKLEIEDPEKHGYLVNAREKLYRLYRSPQDAFAAS